MATMPPYKAIKYTAPENVKGRAFSWMYRFEDGESKRIPEDITVKDATIIQRKFRDRFELIPNKKAAIPGANKMMTPESNKSEAETEPEQAPVVLTETEQAQLKAIEKKLKKDPEGKKLSEYERDLLEKAKAAKG